MYCHQCGNQIKDGLKFCPQCGAELRIETTAQTDKSRFESAGRAPVQTEPAVPPANNAAAGKRKKWVLPAAAGIIVVVVAALLAVVLCKPGEQKQILPGERLWTQDELAAQFPQLAELSLTQEIGNNIDAVYSAAGGQMLICARAVSSASGRAVLAAVQFDPDTTITGAAFRADFEPEEMREQLEAPSFSDRFTNQSTLQQVDVSDLGESGEAAKEAVQAAVNHVNEKMPQEAPPNSVPAASEPAAEASPMDGIPMPSSVKGYRVVSGAGNLRMRAQPNTDAEIIGLLHEGRGDWFYMLKEENGWGYGVYAGQIGWCSLEYLTLYEYQREEILPDFLPPALQIRYLQAVTLYDHTRWGSDLRDFSTEIYLDDSPYCKTGLFLGQYAVYEGLVHSLFTGPHAEDAFLNNGHFKNYNGQLYETCGDGGCILGVDLRSYSFRLESQTDDTIMFTLVGNYDGYRQDTGGSDPYTKEWPITMVKESDGQWRFTQFASPVNGDLGF